VLAHTLTHSLIFKTYPPWGQKIGFVSTIIALSSHAPPPLSQQKKSQQILFNNEISTCTVSTQEYRFLSHLPLLTLPVSVQDITRRGAGDTIRTPLNHRNLSLICLVPPHCGKNRPKLSSGKRIFFPDSFSPALVPFLTHFVQLSIIRWLLQFSPSLQATWKSKGMAHQQKNFFSTSFHVGQSWNACLSEQCAKHNDEGCIKILFRFQIKFYVGVFIL